MNIVKFNGGLGNQMFQYAFSLALNAAGRTTKLDVSLLHRYPKHNGYELERVFGITPKYASKYECLRMADLSDCKWAVFRRNTLNMSYRGRGTVIYEKDYGYRYSPELLQYDNAYFVGFWQSEKYFLQIADAVRQAFTFRTTLDEKNAETADAINACNAVSLHVRCGDYLKQTNIQHFGSVCTPLYYQRAIDRFHAMPDVRFFVFSDDIDWVKTHLTLPNSAFYVNINLGAESYRDMQLMSLCRNHIIANSTFSWWGAWLNPKPDKIVVAPKPWFGDGDNPDIVPESWERMERE